MSCIQHQATDDMGGTLSRKQWT